MSARELLFSGAVGVVSFALGAGLYVLLGVSLGEIALLAFPVIVLPAL